MGDQKIGSKNFNPYDLGAVGEVMREQRATGRLNSLRSDPYIPPQGKRNGPESGYKDTGNSRTSKS